VLATASAADRRRLAREGARLVLADLDVNSGSSLVDALRATFIASNAGDEQQGQEAAETIDQRFGGLDILVHCPVIFKVGSILGTDLATLECIMRINLTGIFLAIHAATPLMTRPRRRIDHHLVVGRRHDRTIAYSISKWAGLRHDQSRAPRRPCQLRAPRGIDTVMVRQSALPPPVPRPIERVRRPRRCRRDDPVPRQRQSSYSTGSEFVWDGGPTTR
jgi:NAD(P)-dependent dehydrogenase (short-subunit alcohol dehydrogenase family)